MKSGVKICMSQFVSTNVQLRCFTTAHIHLKLCTVIQTIIKRHIHDRLDIHVCKHIKFLIFFICTKIETHKSLAICLFMPLTIAQLAS